MGKVDAPNAGVKAVMWEGFGSVANNNITTPIKSLCWGEDHCSNLLCWVKKKKNHTITKMDIWFQHLHTHHAWGHLKINAAISNTGLIIIQQSNF